MAIKVQFFPAKLRIKAEAPKIQSNAFKYIQFLPENQVGSLKIKEMRGMEAKEMEAKERIIVALDVDSIRKAKELVEELRDHVGYFKIGLEFINSMLRQVISPIWLIASDNLVEIHQLFELLAGRIFWDGKFNDIPNTVAKASRAVTKMGVKMFNVHCLGGSQMMKEAKQAAEEASRDYGIYGIPRPLVFGVTILTSLNCKDLVEMGVCEEFHYADPEAQAKAEKHRLEMLAVHYLAWLAQECELDGVIASPHEIRAIREYCQPEFLIVTPGIRPKWAAVGDQKRITTPKEAIILGADYLVIGRPITNPPKEVSNPVKAAKLILEEVEEGLEERKRK